MNEHEYTLEQAMGTIASDARRLLEAELQGDILVDPSRFNYRVDTARKVQTNLLLSSLKAHRALQDYSRARGSFRRRDTK